MTATDVKLQKVIFHLVNRFAKKYGGDYDEWLSVANLAAAKAVSNYKNGVSELPTFVWCYVQFKLRTELKRRREERSRPRTMTGQTAQKIVAGAEANGKTPVAEMLEGSRDARAVMLLLLSIKSRPCKRWTQACATLLSNGWTRGRLSQVFRQMRDAALA